MMRQSAEEGLSCQISLLKTLHQSLILRDQLWASLSSATLDFKQPVHQLGEFFHGFLQEGMARVAIR
jgi:hypothetical protein